MSQRKAAFVVECSRCTRTEYKAEVSKVIGFTAKLGEDASVVFLDLCGACEKVIRTSLQQIAKPLQKASRSSRK